MTYQVKGPALISFSGGRTSAFMLRQILDAYGGRLPEDVRVVFANTGKEREETLRFVHECEMRWSVPIHWIEWRATPSRLTTASLATWLSVNDPDHRMISADGFDRVGFNSASRGGEPFAALIAMKQRLPNWQERWCTEFLKVKPLFALAESFGWKPGSYGEIIGLRDDEAHRVLKSLDNANFKWDRKTKASVPRVPPRDVRFPLSRARVIKADVMAFWKAQSFDLGLDPHEGNCDFCFMKGRGIRKRIIRDRPETHVWWQRQENEQKGFFDKRGRVAEIVDEVRHNPSFFDAEEDDEYDVECGLHCAPMGE